MRRGGPEAEACGVWLDAAALKRRKVQVGRWGAKGCLGDPEVMEVRSETEKGTALGIQRQEGVEPEEGWKMEFGEAERKWGRKEDQRDLEIWDSRFRGVRRGGWKIRSEECDRADRLLTQSESPQGLPADVLGNSHPAGPPGCGPSACANQEIQGEKVGETGRGTGVICIEHPLGARHIIKHLMCVVCNITCWE